MACANSERARSGVGAVAVVRRLVRKDHQMDLVRPRGIVAGLKADPPLDPAVVPGHDRLGRTLEVVERGFLAGMDEDLRDEDERHGSVAGGRSAVAT